MTATLVNFALILAGSFLGILFKSRINERRTETILNGLAICVVVIGLMSAIGTRSILAMIICLVAGTAAGELLRIEDRLDALGEKLRKRVSGLGEGGRFTEGFVGATLLFCVGSMAIMGSFEAGINHDYGILLSKSVIDGVTALAFSAAMGIGVAFSALSVLIYQGLLTLLAIWVGPYLTDPVITEMSSVGGVLLIATGFNLLGLKKDGRIRVANMLPGIFLPIGYIPLADWISGIF